jgi:coenzyme F420-reducing hydrogenase gamma subunit
MEDELLDLAQAVDIAMFLEATRVARPGPYDVALVEGSITTQHEVERIEQIRRDARIVVALGTCATAGGVQALRNYADASRLAETVYPHPEYLHFLGTSRPISEIIKPDLELWGCPVNKAQVIEVIVALLNDRKPNLPGHSVCIDCKRRGTSCILVDKGVLCLGPATQAGCGAICPALGRGCYGCFGPARQANTDSLAAILRSHEVQPGDACRLFRGISGNAPVFGRAAEGILALAEENK